MNVSIIVRMSLSLAILIIFGLFSAHAETIQIDTIDVSIQNYLKSICDNDLKQITQDKALLLKSEDPIIKRKAIQFFCDLKASNVIISLLASGDLVARSYIVDNCLGVFSSSDLPSLYSVTINTIPTTISSDGELNAMIHSMVNKINMRVAALLNIDYRQLTTVTRNSIQNWWIEAIQNAITDKKCINTLENILAQILKQ